MTKNYKILPKIGQTFQKLANFTTRYTRVSGLPNKITRYVKKGRITRVTRVPGYQSLLLFNTYPFKDNVNNLSAERLLTTLMFLSVKFERRKTRGRVNGRKPLNERTVVNLRFCSLIFREETQRTMKYLNTRTILWST